jgi:membrane protein implicated in regulation of membrane protease activity
MTEGSITGAGVAMYVICWLLLAAIFLIVEIVSLGLTSIWFTGGSFVAAIAAACGANVTVQIVLFAVVSIVLLVLTRPLAKRHLDAKTEKTNAEALIGQTALVLQEINNRLETGQAKVNGMEWTARAGEDTEIIPPGAIVSIVDIQGVKLIVKAAEESVIKTV